MLQHDRDHGAEGSCGPAGSLTRQHRLRAAVGDGAVVRKGREAVYPSSWSVHAATASVLVGGADYDGAATGVAGRGRGRLHEFPEAVFCPETQNSVEQSASAVR